MDGLTEHVFWATLYTMNHAELRWTWPQEWWFPVCSRIERAKYSAYVCWTGSKYATSSQSMGLYDQKRWGKFLYTIIALPSSPSNLIPMGDFICRYLQLLCERIILWEFYLMVVNNTRNNSLFIIHCIFSIQNVSAKMLRLAQFWSELPLIFFSFYFFFCGQPDSTMMHNRNHSESFDWMIFSPSLKRCVIRNWPAWLKWSVDNTEVSTSMKHIILIVWGVLYCL